MDLPREAANLDALHQCSWVDRLPNVTLCTWSVSKSDLLQFQRQFHYPRFYYQGARRVRYCLWHYIGLQLARLDAKSTVVDVGAQAGLWGSMIRKKIGCRVYDLDLEYRPGVHRNRIGATASSIPLPDQSVTHIVSFCAFNCFEGADDTSLIHQASRLLVPGGSLAIVPLCIGDEYVNLYDPGLIEGIERLDAGARPAPMPGWGNNFGRWYDRDAFVDRILSHAGSFDVEIHRISHPQTPQGHFDATYAARLIRR